MSNKVLVTHKLIEKVDSYNLVKHLSFETVNNIDLLENPENLKIADDVYLRITDENDNNAIVVINNKQFLPSDKISSRTFYGKVLSNKSFFLDNTIEYDEEKEEDLVGDESIGIFTKTHFETIDLHNIDSKGVELMNCMFLDCKELKDINFANIDTSSCIDMQWMFSGCSSLEKLDLSSFDTIEVIDMGYMFIGCSSLIYLDLKSFVTDNVVTTDAMFSNCENLQSIDLSTFTTDKVYTMCSMFAGCSSLGGLDISGFKTDSLDEDGVEEMFDYCNAILLNRENTDKLLLDAYDNRELEEDDDEEG